MIGVLGLAVATAAEPVIDLEVGDEDLPSAIDGTTFDVAAAEAGEDGVVPLVIVRGQNFLRLTSGLTWLEDDDGTSPLSSRIGAELGRRWYTLGPARVPWVAEVFGGASAPFLGARGVRLSAGGTLAPRLGPVAVGVGPHLRWDRTTWTGDGSELVDTVVAGPKLAVSVGLGPLQPSLAVEPGWQLGGERSPVEDRVLPVLGDETTWRAGLGLQLKHQLWLPSIAWRETAGGPEVEVLLQMRLVPRRGVSR